MHKLITAILLFLGLSSFGQSGPDTTLVGITSGLDTVYKVVTVFEVITLDSTVTTFTKSYIPPSYVRQNLIMDFTVEQADALSKFGVRLYNYWNGLDRASNALAYAFLRVNNLARSGSWSMRVELRKTDNDVANSKRAEARRASNDEPTLKERWYGASYYLPSDYISDPAPELITQWQSLKGVSPPLALWTINGRWHLVQYGTTHTDIGAYAKEKWTDFVFHVKWSLGSDGLIEVWKDGTKIYTKSGANTYAGYTTGNYMKSGIYKWPWKSAPSSSNTTRRVIYVDDVRIGDESASYDDVKPGN